MIEALDHVNLRTGQLDTMVDWYGRVLMMQPGARPAFGFPGAWLYAGDQAVIHLIEDGAVDGPGGDTLALEHFALRASGTTPTATISMSISPLPMWRAEALRRAS